jgi:hypothetical protein
MRDKLPEMLKINEMQYPKIISIKCLTSNDVSAHNPENMEQEIPKAKKKPLSNYPLRFRSKAQKDRLEKAARSVRKTLKDFLIDLGEKAAAEMDSGLKAS